jgi:leucyl-tRNA synthetase
MVLKDLGFLDFEEPTKSFFAHGMIIKDGAKMSKSRGNVVNPDEYIEKYGADALRLYFMFMGPASDGGDFRDSGMAGMRRWVEKVYQIISTQITNLPTSGKPDVMLQKLLGGMAVKAAKDIEARHYNTTIAKMMEFLNVLQKNKSQMSKPQLESFLIIFSVFAPHLAEQLWEQLNGANTSSVHVAAWPKGQSEIVVENMPLAVMINGKLRGTVMADTQELAEKLARRKISKWLENQTIQKVIYVPGRVINFVIK